MKKEILNDNTDITANSRQIELLKKNFIADIIWEKKYTRANDAKWFSDNHDYILCYAKRKENFEVGQLQLTHLMGFKSVSLVSQAEICHNQHFSLKHLFMIASILECDINDFFDGVVISKLDWE